MALILRSSLPVCRKANFVVSSFLRRSICVSSPRSYAVDEKGNSPSSISNKKPDDLQRSYLEEIFTEHVGEPKTTTGKVKRTATNTFFVGCLVASVCALGALGYLLFQEFFNGGSPQKIYSNALKLIKNDDRCTALLGSKLKGFGEESGRGRRRHVASYKYETDGQKRVRVTFHVKGDRAFGRAYAEMANIGGIWEYRFLYVESSAASRPVVLIDNR